MSNALSVLDQAPQLPAGLANMFAGEDSNLAPKATVPSLSYKGKVWSISLHGEETKLEKKNADGDTEPLNVMRVVLLDYTKRRGRAFYEGEYDPEKVSMPKCWSDDGLVPSSNVKEPQAAACASCPKSVKGSKVTQQGKSVTACSQHRMIALVPSFNLDFEPLRLKLAVTSDYDGLSPDHEAAGWYGFQQYLDLLRARQVPHTCMLVTKMKFDPNVAYPKVMFGVDKWLTTEQIEKLAPIAKSEGVKTLISGGWQPNGVDAEKIEPANNPETAKPAAAALAAAKKAADDEAAAKKAIADAEAAAKKAAAADDDDEGDVVMGGAPATKVEPKKAEVSPKPTHKATPKAETKKAETKAPDAPGVTVPGDISDLLKDWE